jgi:HSP20 family protein
MCRNSNPVSERYHAAQGFVKILLLQFNKMFNLKKSNMTLVKTKPNGSVIPKLVSDFFDTDLFSVPKLFDFNGLKVPAANVSENNAAYTIELAAPGFDKNDLKVEVDSNVLTISASREKEKKDEKENYRRREFAFESFTRSFNLPENGLPEKVSANYENGILKISLPKKEVTLPKSKKEIKIS